MKHEAERGQESRQAQTSRMKSVYSREVLRRIVAATLVALALQGCGDARIDGSDAERARVTIGEVRRSLPADRREEFDKNLEYLMRRGAELPLLRDERVRKEIDGKTATEVIAAGEAFRKIAEQRMHDEKVQHDLAELRATMARVEAANASRIDMARERATASALILGPPQGSGASIELVDRDVQEYCARKYLTNAQSREECERMEMASKRRLTGPLHDELGGEIAGRMRQNCTAKHPESYVEQDACENTDAAAIANIIAHPDVMKTLRAERQDELRRLMGH